MKKFLCYDTNDAASGKINVDNRGMLKPNSTVPSGSTPYQQLVTDGDGSTQWEDRLAYVATQEQVIFSQEDIAFNEISGALLYGSEGFDMPDTIGAGEKYRVNFDGETYDCIAYINPLDLPTNVYIGNNSIYGGPDNTGEPFMIGYYSEAQKINIATKLTSPTHTVSISRFVETVHTIPQKLLPEKKKFYVDTSNTGPIYLDSEGSTLAYAEDFISAVNSAGIDFMALNISSAEVHLQMIDYGIIKENGSVMVDLSNINDAGVIKVLTYTANSSSIVS